MRAVLLMHLLAVALPAPAADAPAGTDAAGGGPFAFAVASDPHNDVDAFRAVLREARDRPAREPKGPPCEWLLVAGDLHALEKEHAAFREEFKTAPEMKAFLPMTGDHATGPQRAFMVREILAPLPQARVTDPDVVSYTFDWKGVRLVVADPNHPAHGASRFLNDAGCRWVEAAIRETPPEIRHILVALHEPPFPRVRHVSEMTDAKRPLRDAFWTMLMRHRARVRAVFTGHTHYLGAMRVADPAGAAANDPKAYPDEPGGIWQVSAGASGEVDDLSFVRVVVDGRSIRAVSYAREGKSTAFRVVKEWALTDLGR